MLETVRMGARVVVELLVQLMPLTLRLCAALLSVVLVIRFLPVGLVVKLALGVLQLLLWPVRLLVRGLNQLCVMAPGSAFINALDSLSGTTLIGINTQQERIAARRKSMKTFLSLPWYVYGFALLPLVIVAVRPSLGTITAARWIDNGVVTWVRAERWALGSSTVRNRSDAASAEIFATQTTELSRLLDE